MSAPDARVSDLVAEGRITPEEGERLQRALQDGRRGTWTIGLNPVEYLRPPAAIALAAAVILVSLAASQLGIRFDGAIDVHRVPATPAWRTALIDQFVAVPFTALVFWLVSLAAWRRGRWQDFAVAIAIARVPALLLCIWSMLMLPELPTPEEMVRLAKAGQIPVRVVIASVGSFPFLAWMVFWLYRGFAFSAGARGGRAVVAFVVALVAAAVLGELVVHALIRL